MRVEKQLCWILSLLFSSHSLLNHPDFWVFSNYALLLSFLRVCHLLISFASFWKHAFLGLFFYYMKAFCDFKERDAFRITFTALFLWGSHFCCFPKEIKIWLHVFWHLLFLLPFLVIFGSSFLFTSYSMWVLSPKASPQFLFLLEWSFH